ncbi:MAG: 2-keto-3-deoxy-D-arabino-heptulosonate-7-phosphate synthase I alpha [uncultured Thermomicrobiales bacterium]|uniref:3-deoxy-7-phosphoheptulonate synthase n=1 Tax=uncultured Thermomicrobiales bacterium TaxID=1645740 RepID=A0A6J4VJK5_9BACT|nr:MAG: 2-keto-3-deoxy-D-arabino-heptulosonate-7-phosphate synthase I alpha [uncultured Thermomicrobiales bacterium]
MILVVMWPGASVPEIDEVRRRAGDHGHQATVFSHGEHCHVLVGSDMTGEILEQLAALPGVAGFSRPGPSARPVTSNLRVAGIRPLVPPAILVERLPLPDDGAVAVHRARQELSRILRGEDDRLIVVVGPCSIHDADAALEYARRLSPLAEELAPDLRVVMRVYFEKPRTTVGWKGLVNDPHLDGSFAVNDGLHLARRFLLDVVALGLPAGCEFLDPITPQFIADAVSWGAIGARTTESQVHRNLTSGLSMPVGFKNGTGGDVQMAVDAMNAAAYPHQFMSVTEQGLAAIVVTRGNRDTHVILRGGRGGPNYDVDHVQRALAALRAGGRPPRVMIDASHGNSAKDYRRQPVVARAVAEQVTAGEPGIIGVMLESFLVDDRQDFSDPAELTFGQSITDACMGWEMTAPVLHELAAAVRARRATVGHLSRSAAASGGG